MSNYDELIKKRFELIDQADALMEEYVEIADKLYSKETGKYAGLIRMNINLDGIEYEYWIDNWDYSNGRDYFHISKEELEEHIVKHTRNRKLKKIGG